MVAYVDALGGWTARWVTAAAAALALSAGFVAAAGPAVADPPDPPDPPTGVTAEAGDESATVSWLAPSDLGDGTLEGYTVTSTPGDQTCTTATTSCTVDGLTNGTEYRFTVVTTTTAGSSEPSTQSNAVTPYRKPGPPTGLTVAPGDGFVDLTWTAPAEPGSGTITTYKVTAAEAAQACGQPGAAAPCGGPSCTTTETSCRVSELTNGTTYRFTAVTNSTVGRSVPSAASPDVTPGAPAVPMVVPPSVDGTLGSSAGGAFSRSSRKTTLSGGGFSARTPVSIAIYPTSTLLTHTVTDGSGAFSVQVTIPGGLSGEQTFLATGAAAGGARTLTLQVTVSSTDPAAAPDADLPVTGTGRSPLVAPGVGLGLLAAGIALLAWLRRYRVRLR